jgi:hypothetical protein
MMTEQELVAKIEEIQSEHFARMNRDLAPYMKKLNALRVGRLSMGNQTLEERYKTGWGNCQEAPNLRAMTTEETEEFRRKHGEYPGSTAKTLTEVLFGFRL